MFESYVIPINSAVSCFPVIAVLLFVPLLIVHYRRFGAVQGARAFVLYSFLFFAMTAVFLVLLPLPSRAADLCEARSALTVPRLIPFTFVSDIARAATFDPAQPNFGALVATREFFQVFFNFLLLMPLGVFLRYYFGRSFLVSVGIALAVSLGFELTQLTGIWGIYPCPYRLFDVDDVILNTGGALVGWLATPLLIFLPDLSAPPMYLTLRVSLLRRAVAFGIDLMLGGIIAGIVTPIFLFILSLMGRNGIDIHAAMLVQVIIGAIWFVILPAYWGGATVGKRVVKIRLAGPYGLPPHVGRLAVRYGLLLLAPAGLTYLMLVYTTFSGQIEDYVLVLGMLMYFCLIAVLYGLPLFRRDRRGLHVLLAGTQHISTWRPDPTGQPGIAAKLAPAGGTPGTC